MTIRIFQYFLLFWALSSSIIFASDLDCFNKELLYHPNGITSFELNDIYSKNLQHSLNEIKSCLSPHLGEITGRPKEVHTIFSKLSQKQQKLGIQNLSFEKAKEFIGDGLGSRLTLKTPQSSETTTALVDQLIEAIHSRKLVVTEIHNYRAPGASPYISDEQAQLIADAASTANGTKVTLSIGENAIKPSGYTGINVNLLHNTPDGLISGEFQIRGQLVDELASVEHLLYDIRRGKPLGPKIDTPEIREIYRIVQSLSKRESVIFENYIQKIYAYTRELETLPERARPPTAPPFPRELARYPGLKLDAIKQFIKNAKAI